MSIHFAPAGTTDVTSRVALTSSVVGRSQSRVSRHSDQVGVAEDVLHHAHVERMPRREVEPAVDVVHRRAERLGELDQGVEALGLAADELGDDHRLAPPRSDRRPARAPPGRRRSGDGTFAPSAGGSGTS